MFMFIFVNFVAIYSLFVLSKRSVLQRKQTNMIDRYIFSQVFQTCTYISSLSQYRLSGNCMVNNDRLPAAPIAVLVHLLVHFLILLFSLLCSFFFFFFLLVVVLLFSQYLKSNCGGMCHFAAKNVVNMKNWVKRTLLYLMIGADEAKQTDRGGGRAQSQLLLLV